MNTLMIIWTITLVVTLVDYVVPDPIPFIDEAILTVIFIVLSVMIGLQFISNYIAANPGIQIGIDIISNAFDIGEKIVGAFK